jgi:uncharacterized membrane protein
MLTLFLEIASFLIFLGCLYHARKSWRNILLLVLAGIYAIIFENLNVILSTGKLGGYSYSQNFNFFIFHTPLFIIFCWAFLIYIVYHLVNRLRIKEFKKLFVDAVLVTSVDFIVDPILATIFGLWKWTGYSASEGFFGIPGNNFLGWLLVTFFFMLIFRKIESSKWKDKKIFYLATPILAYACFILCFTLVNIIQQTFNFSKTAELVFFFVIYGIFAGIGFWKFFKRR